MKSPASTGEAVPLTLEKEAPTQPVANCQRFSGYQAELNLYETFEPAYGLTLRFETPLLVSMLSGRKVMHLEGWEAFEFGPGQSLMLAAGQRMTVDCLEASPEAPTRCMALALSSQLIEETHQLLETHLPEENEAAQAPGKINAVLLQEPNVQAVVHRLIRHFRESGPMREPLTRFALQELITYLMQTQARSLLLRQESTPTNPNRSRVAAAVAYIRRHLDESLLWEQVARYACMSRRQLFRAFKQELGTTPEGFLRRERLVRAKAALAEGHSVQQAAYEAGFGSVHQFIRAFKKAEGCTPKQYALHHRAG
jgi:AraC-like DNA-binding protein